MDHKKKYEDLLDDFNQVVAVITKGSVSSAEAGAFEILREFQEKFLFAKDHAISEWAEGYHRVEGEKLSLENDYSDLEDDYRNLEQKYDDLDEKYERLKLSIRELDDAHNE